MNEIKHTPGEWSVGGQGWVVVDEFGKWIGDGRTVNRDVSEEHANVCLMAAAPQLLASLREIYKQIDKNGVIVLSVEAQARAKDAIAKATGESA